MISLQPISCCFFFVMRTPSIMVYQASNVIFVLCLKLYRLSKNIKGIIHTLRTQHPISFVFIIFENILETNLTLPQKYVEFGFTISKLGRGSAALRFQHRTIFIFGSRREVSDDFINWLCDHYMHLFTRVNINNKN